jgi:hypothetical protein
MSIPNSIFGQVAVRPSQTGVETDFGPGLDGRSAESLASQVTEPRHKKIGSLWLDHGKCSLHCEQNSLPDKGAARIKNQSERRRSIGVSLENQSVGISLDQVGPR